MFHEIRTVVSLNGMWDFAFLGPCVLESFDPTSIEFRERLPVPSAFDALPAHPGRRGTAAYRCHFRLKPGRPARIAFGAVSLWSRVYIDGVPQKEHACGYTPFTVEVPPAGWEERELMVVVDNRFDFARVPMHEEYFDFYQYGGIIRDVALHMLPPGATRIEHVQVAPGAGYRDGRVKVTVELGGKVGAGFVLATRFDRHDPIMHANVPVTDGRVILDLTVPQPQVWSPESPALHVLRVSLIPTAGAEAYDDAVVSFGLRRVEAHSGRLWLNGEPLQLRGYNRHEWHPNFGPCTPLLQMTADLQLLRDLGCNFIRGSHYPQDQRFLDLCDEFGFLVWEENLGWGQREHTFSNEKFLRDHQGALQAMVRASCNHPCVIIWGFLNEAATDQDYVRPVLEKTVATLRELDATRLISYASMFALTDLHFDLVDIISLNIYPGWYDCAGVEEPLGLIAPFMRKCFAHLDDAGFVDKPIIISEIGAEALYGWHDAHRDFFTEEYQAEYLKHACTEALANSRCSGIALWQYSDVRTYGGGWAIRRPRTYNNKGTVDEYRRPKMAYEAVKRVFRGKSAH